MLERIGTNIHVFIDKDVDRQYTLHIAMSIPILSGIFRAPAPARQGAAHHGYKE
jgi:hypothetical protein